MSLRQARFALAALLASIAPCGSAAAAAPVKLVVDATEAPRRIFHARLVIPAAPGPLLLRYPKWIPGEHGPTGPLDGVTGLRFSAGGRTLAWRRDEEEMYAFHLTVPPGARAVEVTFDFVSRVATEGFSAGASADAALAVVSWNQLLLYPDGPPAEELTYEASLRLPPSWKIGTALPVARAAGGRVDFQPASLATLVDSPVLAGAIMRSVPLTPGRAPAEVVDLAADSEAALEIAPAQIARWKDLVAEGAALFGATHFRDYHFLLSLSNHLSHGGLEHHESSDDRVAERTLVDDDARVARAGLLPHEYVHSWNGKYRRPAGLATPSYHQPMKTELLWVYEGLTTYLGDVLAARSGMWTPEEARAQLALTAAQMEHTAGRAWRPLIDTAVAARTLYGAPKEWASWRRQVDFYPEMQLVWLEVDTIIRRQTEGRRSLDDFCKAFYGAPSGPPAVRTYTLDDVVRALDDVAPHDWRGFFASRLEAVSPRPPLAGIEAAGWRLGYGEIPTSFGAAYEKSRGLVDLTFSIGLLLRDDGTVVDVVPGLPAATAGVAPGMEVEGVNGRRFSPQDIRDAVRATKGRPDLDLLLANGDAFRALHLEYRGGARYPRLDRAAGPDLLSDILRPRAAPPPGAR